MKISIVIATFNAGEYLANCLDSCIRQTWRDKEIIVIDGGSSDTTLDVIQTYSAHLAFWSSERDKGIYDAWNKGLKQVTGSWVLFRGADDLFWDDLSLELAALGLKQAAPNELFCYGRVIGVDDKDNILGVFGYPWKQSRAKFFRQMSIPHTGTFHHIELFKRFGLFDTTYRIAGDYDFLLRVLMAGGVEGKFLPEVIVTRMYGGGVSNNQGVRTKMEGISTLRRNRVSIFPLAQYLELLKIVFLAMRRKLLETLLGPSRSAKLRERRRRRISDQLRAAAFKNWPNESQSDRAHLVARDID